MLFSRSSYFHFITIRQADLAGLLTYNVFTTEESFGFCCYDKLHDQKQLGRGLFQL